MALSFLRKQQILVVRLEGDLRYYDNKIQEDKLFESARRAKGIKVFAQDLKQWDSALAAVLFQLELIARQKKVLFDKDGLPNNLKQLLDLSLAVEHKINKMSVPRYNFLEKIGKKGVLIYEVLGKVADFLDDVIRALGRLAVGKAVMRSVDFEFALEDCGYKAVGIVCLVSFMVGLILAFVGALQLRMFGAEIYIASLVTVGMIRIMGAIMVGIIMAGRTGAAYAATIGTMQVNEEIDALKTFGFEISDFLVLPRFLSLVITMPLLTMVADLSGIVGGAFIAVMVMDISISQYWLYALTAFGVVNFLIGLFHGFVYGVIIALCGCYYGVTCGRDADSVGWATTRAVVASIVIMIVVTGMMTLVFEALKV